MSFTVIIPARYAATRLPGKPLLQINKKPLLQYVYESATKSQASNILIATDDIRIKEAAEGFGAQVVMTSAQHLSGTDRIAEAASHCALPDNEMIVNVQGDVYGLAAKLIDQTALALKKNTEKQIATLCTSLTDSEKINDCNTVKVVIDNDRNALYFSRLPLPWEKGGTDTAIYRRHIGIYAYTTHNLQRFTQLPVCMLEQSESLEQLRALYHGWKIHVETAATNHAGVSVDTAEDLKHLQSFINRAGAAPR